MRAVACPNTEARRLGLGRDRRLDKVKWKSPDSHRSRLQRASDLVPRSERPRVLQAPDHEPCQLGHRSSTDWREGIHRGDLCAFSDGSSAGPGRSSWGFQITSGTGLALAEGCGPLLGTEVFDAELEGALRALTTALQIERTGRIVVLLDNQAAASSLGTGQASSSQRRIDRFKAAVQQAPCEVEVRWILGYKGILENEHID